MEVHDISQWVYRVWMHNDILDEILWKRTSLQYIFLPCKILIPLIKHTPTKPPNGMIKASFNTKLFFLTRFHTMMVVAQKE